MNLHMFHTLNIRLIGQSHEYENDLLTRLASDVWPHPRFFNTDEGEYKAISCALSAPSSPSVIRSPAAGVHASSATSTLTRSKFVVCPFHLFHVLDMKRHNGTSYEPCTHGSSCSHGHVDTITITAAEATLAVQSSGLHQPLIDRAIACIQANPGSFKP